MGDSDPTKSPSANDLHQCPPESNELIKVTYKTHQPIPILKENEEFFKAITQNSNDITIIVNKIGEIIYVNPAIEHFMGYKPDELIGKSAFHYICKTDLPRAICDFGRAVLTKGVIIPNAFGVRHKNGSIRILEGVGKSMFGNPSVQGFVMNVRDVTEKKKAEDELKSYHKRLEALVEERTAELNHINQELRLQLAERKRAEEELRKSEARFRTLIQKSSDVISILGEQGHFTYNSPSAETVLGYTPKVLWGKSPFDFIHPDDHVIARAAYETVISRTNPGTPTEFRFQKADGSWIYLEALGQNLLDYPGINGIVITSRDVTERKQAEERLRESETRFKEMADLLPEAVFEADMNLKFTFLNHKALSFFGYNENEVREKATCPEMIIPEDRERARHNFEQRMNGTVSGAIEYTALRKDGTIFPALISSTIIIRDDIPAGLRGIVIDLTKSKKTEEALRASEQMIKSILSATPVGLGLTVDRKIKWVNDIWMQMFGFDNEKECVDRPVASLYSSGESYEESRSRIYKILANDRIATIEAYMSRQDGYLFPAQINVAPLDPSDLKRGNISAILDISEWKRMEQSLRESEERYRLAMEATSDGLWDWDIVSGTVNYSPVWYQILGNTMGNDFSCWKSKLHPEEVGAFMESLTDHLNGETESWTHEHRLKTESEKWKWVLGRGLVIARDITGKPLRMVGTIIDIDDRKLLESQLAQAQKMEAIGTLAGGIAHDFNNILGSISGYTELSLMKNHSQDSRGNYLQQVLKACDRAKNLVNQILLFSRQREGEKKPVEITLIVKEALNLLRASLPSTIKIKQNWSSDSFLVIADPTQIHQIIMNLCTNAAHAMRDNGGMLEVSISRFRPSGKTQMLNPRFKIGPYVHLKVSDTGHGIDPVILDKIFDPFFTTKKQGEGTGLGLSVVYGIIKSYDGLINVNSKIGLGSTFDIYLPCVDVENHELVIQCTETPLNGSERILVIDDEEDLVSVMDKYLSSIGYHVTTTTSSPEALQIIRNRPDYFDLVITDMTMPQMTGLKLSREIHAIRPEIPIILCTGYDVSITETDAKKKRYP